MLCLAACGQQTLGGDDAGAYELAADAGAYDPVDDVGAYDNGAALEPDGSWIDGGSAEDGSPDVIASKPPTQKPPTQKPPPFNGFYLPFKCGKKVRVTQGNKSSFSHTAMSAYAFDFSLGIGTPMIAMARGTVVHVYKKTKPGDACYKGGDRSCIAKANVVWVKHPDGTRTIYAHLSSVKVSVGQKVSRGQVLGRSGSSGYSTGPHAHVGRMKTCCQTIPLKFKDVAGNGVPKTGNVVTSGNCP